MSTPDAYVILIGPTPDGHYGARAPDLPGCIALGDTIEETEREMREAIAFHLDGLRADGLPLPAPRTVTATVPVVAA